MNILLVEDDEMIGVAVKKGLGQEGFVVDWVKNADEAGLALESKRYEVLLLDLGLPDRSGLEVLNELRKRGDTIAAIILTARDAVADRITGLDSGADDYLVKPFDLDELSARIRAVQRRKLGRAEPLLESGRLSLNPASRECFWQGPCGDSVRPGVLSARSPDRAARRGAFPCPAGRTTVWLGGGN